MPTLGERVRNLWRDDLDRPKPRPTVSPDLARDYEIHAARLAGRTEIAAELTENLGRIREQIPVSWVRDEVENHVPRDIAGTYFTAQIDMHNDLAGVLHKLDQDGKINAAVLPEMMHPESVGRAVSKMVYDIREGRLRQEVERTIEGLEQHQDMGMGY